MTSKVWRVVLSDCDRAYVLAGSEAEARTLAVEELMRFSGGDAAETIEDVPEVTPTLIMPENFGPKTLVDSGVAVWRCTMCDGLVSRGMPARWDGEDVTCEDCMREVPMGAHVESASVILLSSEY